MTQPATSPVENAAGRTNSDSVGSDNAISNSAARDLPTSDSVTAAIAPEYARTWLMRSGRPAVTSAWDATAADALVIDLEDAVPPTEKQAARDALVAAFASGRRAWVRINAFGSGQWCADVEELAALDNPGSLLGVVLAKTEAPEQVARTVATLPGVLVVPLIESARGLQQVDAIAEVGGVLRLGFGSGDFRRDTGFSVADHVLGHARSRITVASAAVGLPGPIDGGARGTDEPALRSQAVNALDFGFEGKFVIDEAQVLPLNQAFAPTPAAVQSARKLIATLDPENPATGDDAPQLGFAHRILTRAAAYGLTEAASRE
ncbi:HpcH/HpaI aldolase/citrate lyase family protein [Gulosibacter chungangensis]|uniref:CoA ester lyase n=1 Tax=Gulosibacter chungangensis TaxID=979746 RepID=A0A7J5BFJ3_9MICO|nr:aldolase/citrate lyase family protein [Gulosibacter chungangensis]KAB1645046.1 CoA ester lyase [Gulosibacter chungangensis]